MAKILFVESDDVEANRVREKLCEHDLQLTAMSPRQIWPSSVGI